MDASRYQQLVTRALSVNKWIDREHRTRMRHMQVAFIVAVSLAKCKLWMSSLVTYVDWVVGISLRVKRTARQSIFYLERMHSLLADALDDEAGTGTADGAGVVAEAIVGRRARAVGVTKWFLSRFDLHDATLGVMAEYQVLMSLDYWAMFVCWAFVDVVADNWLKFFSVSRRPHVVFHRQDRQSLHLNESTRKYVLIKRGENICSYLVRNHD